MSVDKEMVNSVAVVSIGEKGGGGACTNDRGRAVWPEGGLGPEYFVYVLFLFLGSIIIFRLYKLILSDQDKISLQVRVKLFDFV
jgi:hypothetical protein